jgi:hypothetical protein
MCIQKWSFIRPELDPPRQEEVVRLKQRKPHSWYWQAPVLPLAHLPIRLQIVSSSVHN